MLSKKRKVDWFKKLSPRAKAEILSGLLHIIVDHSPKVSKHISKRSQRQLSLALNDCSIWADDMTAVDFRHIRKYYQDLEDRTA